MARYDVDDSGDGVTRMQARVIERAIAQRLATLHDVSKVRTSVTGGKAHVVVAAKRHQDDDLLGRINAALGHDFWIDLGMADMTYSITIKPG